MKPFNEAFQLSTSRTILMNLVWILFDKSFWLVHKNHLRPVLSHFMPINSSRLYNHVELIFFPNFCRHFSKRYFVRSIVVEGHSVRRKLKTKALIFYFSALTCWTSKTLYPRLVKHLFSVFVPHFGKAITTTSGYPGYSLVDILLWSKKVTATKHTVLNALQFREGL